MMSRIVKVTGKTVRRFSPDVMGLAPSFNRLTGFSNLRAGKNGSWGIIQTTLVNLVLS